jgi:hypothetical protein
VAAGNSATNFASFVPAAYPEALTVTAMSDSDGLAGGSGGAPTCRAGETDDAFATFSNFAVVASEQNHAVAGPGVCILSTWLGGGYNTISGTSMATPHLSGTVALCLGSGGVAGPCSGLTPAQIVQQIRTDAQTHATAANGFSGDPLHPVIGKYFGYLAFAGGYGVPDTTPPTISAVAASTTAMSATITWTTNEPASSQVEYWKDPAFPTATAVTDTAPRVTNHSVTIGGLTASTTYGFHVKSADAAGNPRQSADSTFVTQTPNPTLAAYAFNEGAGATTADASGKGHTGALSGATWTTAGKYGKALSFNGSTSYVDLGNAADLQISGSMTWSAWIFATANPVDDGDIVSKGWQFKTSPDTGPHTFAIAITDPGGAYVGRYSTTVRALNTWYHVAGVYDAAARTLNIYVNGVPDNGVLIGTVPASQLNAPDNVTIGRRSGGYYFQGTIDELRLYNRALSQTEIQSDMNTAIGGP